MAEWQDDGLVLGARRHGERGVILQVLTVHRGVASGFLKGANHTALTQVGSLCHFAWRARLSEHLGVFKAELITSYAAPLLLQRGPLLALQSSAELIRLLVPEAAAHPEIYTAWHGLLEALNTPVWAAAYTRFELHFLQEIGFGLSLDRCVATGEVSDLRYVSPKSGCAVSAAAGAPYHTHMLLLPPYLRDSKESAPPAGDVRDAFALTGFFLERALVQMHQKVPGARGQLASHFKGEG